MEHYSTGAAVRFGWNKFQERPGILIGAMLITTILSWILNAISRGPAPEQMHSMSIGWLLAFVVASLLNVLIGMGTTAFMLKAHDDIESVTLKDLWHPHPFRRYLLANVAATAIVIVGLILIIVPGIIVALALLFVNFIVIEREISAADALRESARITKGYRWQLFGLLLAVVGINILGLLCLGVGLLVSIPVSTLAIVHAYRSLSGEEKTMPGAGEAISA